MAIAFRATLLLATATLLGGCDTGPTAEEFLAKAQAAIAANDTSAAVVELKNTLQVDPKNADARWLLGDIYMKSSQGAAALKEFERAQALGIKSDKLVVAMLRARLLQGQFQEVLKELPKASVTSKTDVLLVIRGDAQLGLQEFDKAESSFEAALKDNPKSAGAHLGWARIALSKRDTDKALTHLNSVITDHPEELQARMLLGEAHLISADFQAAEEAFNSARKLTNNGPGATLGLARALVAQKRAEEAQPHLEGLHKASPTNPLVNYLRAVVAQHLKDVDGTLEALREVLRIAPNHAQSLLMMGALSFDRKEYRQAEDFLSRFVSAAPQHIPARKLLATVHLALTQNAEAISTLEGSVNEATDDAQLLALLGSAYLANRDAENGTRLLERAAGLDPKAAAIRTQLALSQLASGDSANAVASLENAVQLDPSFTRADLLLIFAHLRNNKWDEAITAATSLAAKREDDPVPLNLLGAAYAGKKDIDKAREYYGKALAADPKFSNAALNIASLDLQQGKTEAAVKRYEALLAINPKLEQASIGLAQVASRSGDLKEVARILQSARRANSKAIGSRLMLSRVLQTQGNGAESFAVAEEAGRIAPKNGQVRLVLGQAYANNGDQKRAISILSELAEEQPSAAIVHFQLAIAHLRSGDKASGRSGLDRTLELNAKHYGALLAKADLESLDGNRDKALTLVEQLVGLAPDAPGPVVLRGDIHMRAKQFDEAEKTYRAALAKVPTGQVLMKLYGALKLGGKSEQARSELEAWHQENPNDNTVRLALASIQQEEGKDGSATEGYEKVLAASPNNVIALNNVAWLYFNDGEPKALEFAKRAYDLAPRHPSIADTYGWFLVESGKVQQGLTILKRAARDAPNTLEIQYHLAVAYAKSGERNKAKPLLQRVVDAEEGLTFKAAAERLLKTM
jgi:putative PEP-CTERM system TPR-repeat lipoprotein